MFNSRYIYNKQSLKNSLVRCAHSFVVQSFATRAYKSLQRIFYEVIYIYKIEKILPKEWFCMSITEENELIVWWCDEWSLT